MLYDVAGGKALPEPEQKNIWFGKKACQVNNFPRNYLMRQLYVFWLILSAAGLLTLDSLDAHGEVPFSGSTSMQSISTSKGFAGVSVDLNFSLGLFSFGLEAQGVAYPEHFDQPQDRILNTVVGFSLMRYAAIEYISGGYWRATANIPIMRLDRIFNFEKSGRGNPFIGLLLAFDTPVAFDHITRYRIGISVTQAAFDPY